MIGKVMCGPAGALKTLGRRLDGKLTRETLGSDEEQRPRVKG